MSRQVGRQVRRDADGTHAGSAAPVRNGKRLVQVQMADIRADGGRAREPNLRIHVRAVHVDLPAMFVDAGADGLDLVLEDAVRRWIRDHQRRQPVAVLAGLLAEISDIDIAV